jgi:hypothetical protein
MGRVPNLIGAFLTMKECNAITEISLKNNRSDLKPIRTIWKDIKTTMENFPKSTRTMCNVTET